MCLKNPNLYLEVIWDLILIRARMKMINLDD